MPEEDPTEWLLRQFYAQQGKLRGYVYSATRDYHATEEILQSTAIVVAQKAASFDRTRAESPWFIGIAKKHIQKWYSQQGRKPQAVSLDSLEHCLPDYEVFETDHIADRRLALKSCIACLPEKQKAIVGLRYEDNCDCSEIADRLDRTVQSVYALLKRLKQELRKCVELRLKKGELA
ncbi:sigma-70 family RNA polymerase sigma factor [Coraliomargarita akajimensis]|nr:sigma-70 family RNA polymerase sigma factor [Coraliomargarita akajimensis]